jgi:Carbohydrate family 9 binding domain-like
MGISSGRREAGRLIHSYKAEHPLPLDGVLAKWQTADRAVFEGPPMGSYPRRATVHTLWDKRSLYFCFDVFSSRLQAVVTTRDGEDLWLDDGVEFLFDPHRHRTKEFLPDDFAYHINILNTVFDDRGSPSGKPDPEWNGSAQHEVKLLGDFRYLVEVAVPWTEIGLEPQEDHTVIGVDFCVNGRDPQTGEYNYFDWCGLKVFHDPSGFGDLALKGPRKR